MINLNMYKEVLHKYSITDCAVRKKGIYVFVVSEILSDEELETYEEEGLDQFYRPKKIVTFIQDGDPSQNGRQWFQNHLIGWDTPRIGASNHPKNHSVTFEISLRRNDIRTFVTGSGPAHEELIDIVPGDSFPRGGMKRLKTIEGYLYSCGGSRDIGKRIDENNWVSLVNALPTLKRETTTDAILESGFEDVDGFSETDIYAGGGKGDLWHFDGENWEPIPFPTNDNIFSLCCAGDGYVYVCCTHGMTFKGRGDNWKKISNGKGEKSFRDMVWHKDRVYCTNDYGLWTIKDDELEKTDVPDEIFACSGHLYANDGVMLLAGLGGAAYCEDGEWTLLYNSSTMDTLLAVKEMEEKANTTQ